MYVTTECRAPAYTHLQYGGILAATIDLYETIELLSEQQYTTQSGELASSQLSLFAHSILAQATGSSQGHAAWPLALQLFALPS
jgi:hypothetical protein